MFLIAAIVAFAIALLFWLASIHHGVFLSWQAFTIIGLLCWAVHDATGWWPARHTT